MTRPAQVVRTCAGWTPVALPCEMSSDEIGQPSAQQNLYQPNTREMPHAFLQTLPVLFVLDWGSHV